MTVTTLHTITPEDGWVEGASGSANVTVQLQTGGPLYVSVGASAPEADAQDALILSEKDGKVFSASGLGETDKVFIRCFDSDTERFVVMKS